MKKSEFLGFGLPLLIWLGFGLTPALIGMYRHYSEEKEDTQQVVHDTVVVNVPQALTEWQMLQLAIAYTESKFDPNAVGKADDLGILQITPIYAREASRLSKDKDYPHNDAYDPEKSLEMFDIVQGHYNPDHDIYKAIKLHNKAPWYAVRVKENMELIKRMESFRQIVCDYEFRKSN